MPKLGFALEGLRSTLLATCGLSIAACTAPAPEQAKSPPPEQEAKSPPPEPSPTPATASKCVSPEPVKLGEQDTGYARCADGALNRARAVACPIPVVAPACKGTEEFRSCESNAECTTKPNGFCKSGWGQRGDSCQCVYPCLSDADCGSGEACMCPTTKSGQLAVAQCAPALCKVNDDCPSGECGASHYFNGCSIEPSLQCRGSQDTCRGDADCSDGVRCSADVTHEGALDPFACTPMSCVIGRPLTVERGVRVASVAGREWGVERLDGLAHDRARAEYWLEVARMEHASVASFARFAQELLYFAAPPQLLRDALVAAADEVRHAEQTFALASAYADVPLGPGPLQVDDLSPTTDLQVFVTRLIVEGCVGETLGVAEALALLEQELDPQLRPRLEQIADDETRHAALAWRTLMWIAPRVDPATIARAFEQAIAQAARVGEEAMDAAHGRLGTRAKRHARAHALASVVEPCRQQIAALTEHPARAWPSRPS